MSARPCLKRGVVVRRQVTREEAYVIIKEPEERKYFKFEDWEEDILTLLDGTRDESEIAAEFGARHREIDVDEQYVVDYVDGLRKMGLIERSEQENHLVMMEKLKTLRKKRFYDAEKSTLFQIHIPLFDPNRILDRVIPWIGWVWSRWFVACWLVIFAGVLGFLMNHWSLYWRGFFSLWNFPEKTFWEWVAFFALLFGVSIWHEFGHAFTCKRYGGEVHDIGIMIFYLQPAFYCSTDDAYLFPSRAHRIYATFGGAYFELMMCSVSMAVWMTTPVEWWAHQAALTLVFFTGLSAIAFNMNPLIRLDGYYVLMDWLDVPNLREDSFEYIGNLLKKHILRLEVSSQPISRRRRRIYVVYGIASLLYTSTVLMVLYYFVRGWLLGWLGPAGYLALFALMGWLFRKKAVAAGRFVKHLWLDKRELARSRRAGSAAVVGLVGLVLLVTVPRGATRIESGFMVEPGERAFVRAPADGIVRNVSAAEGRHVRRGELLAVLENRELKAESALAAADLDRAERAAAGARSEGDIAGQDERRAEAKEAEVRMGLLGTRLRGLNLVAPIDGIVSTRDADQSEAKYLKEGDVLCSVDDLGRVKLAVMVSERELEAIRAGMAIRMTATAWPGRTLTATVRSVSPLAVAPASEAERSLDLFRRVNLIRVLAEIDNEDGRLRPGMTGRVQFLSERRSLAGRFWWRFSRWAASLVW